MEIEDFTHILEEIVNRLKQLDPEQSCYLRQSFVPCACF
jgi:hypothetical protein